MSEPINFSKKTAAQFTFEYNKSLPTLLDIQALEKFSVVFELYEYLKKQPSIKKWAVVFAKSEYTDEGCECGVYTDFTTDPNKTIETPNWDLDRQYYDIKTKRHTKINSILNNYRDMDAFPCEVYENNEKGMHRMIEDFIGKEYLVRFQQETLNTSIPETSKIKKPHKM